MAAIPFTIVFFLCRSFFIEGWPSSEVLVVYFASLALGFLLGYYLECCIGTGFVLVVGSWVTDIYFHVDELLSVGAHVPA